MGGLGGTIGGILGAGLGTFVAPGLGTTAGASLGTGIGQLIQGGIQKKKAKGILPSPEDVGERALLSTLRRRQQMLSTGTSAEFSKNKLSETLKTLTRGAFNAGGQVNPSMYAGLIGQTVGNIAQQTSQEMAQTLGAQSQLIKDMANRKADLSLLEYTGKQAEAAQNIQDSGQNLAAALQPKGEFVYNELGETPEEQRKRKREEAKAAKDAKDAAKTEGLTEG